MGLEDNFRKGKTEEEVAEQERRRIEATRAFWRDNPAVGERRGQSLRRFWGGLSEEEKQERLGKSFHSEESGLHRSEGMQRFWDGASDEWKEQRNLNLSEAMKRSYRDLSEEERAWRAGLSRRNGQQSMEVVVGLHKDSRWREWWFEQNRVAQEDCNEQRVESLRRYWRDISAEGREEWLRKTIEGWQRRPTEPEVVLGGYLSRVYSDRFVYNGDGKGPGVVAGLIPDFVEVGGNRLVEVFGDYWHAGEDTSVKVEHYRKHGFECLVIWEYECWLDEVLDRRFSEFMRQSEVMPSGV